MIAGFLVGVLFLTWIYVPAEPIVAAYFYVWYSADGRHWNDSSVTVVVDRPVAGYYTSNYTVFVRQMKLMKDVGVDVVFVSWWGPRSYEDGAAREAFRAAREVGLKAAILVEPYLGSNASYYDEAWWDDVLSHVSTHFVEPYADVYFTWEGRPLILAFNPIGEVYKPSCDKFTIRIVGNDVDDGGYRDWDLWPDYDVALSGRLKVRRDGYVALTPRFDDYYLYLAGGRSSYRRIDVDYAAGWYEKQWRFVLGNRGAIRLVAIYSWNEYHERSQIEPHYDATSLKPAFYLLEVTGGYASKLSAMGVDMDRAALMCLVLGLAAAGVVVKRRLLQATKGA